MTSNGMHERLEAKVEHALGTGDLRMLYGVGVPFLIMTFLIIGALVTEAVWLTAPLMVLIGVFTAVVLVGLNHMLDDEDGSREPR
jgi:hypothetical protein